MFLVDPLLAAGHAGNDHRRQQHSNDNTKRCQVVDQL